MADSVQAALLQWHQGRCGICGTPSKSGYARVLDVDAATGLMRGWLCWSCDYRGEEAGNVHTRYIKRHPAAIVGIHQPCAPTTFGWWIRDTPQILAAVASPTEATNLFTTVYGANAPRRMRAWPLIWEILLDRMNPDTGCIPYSIDNLVKAASKTSQVGKRPPGKDAVAALLAWCRAQGILHSLHPASDETDIEQIYIVTRAGSCPGSPSPSKVNAKSSSNPSVAGIAFDQAVLGDDLWGGPGEVVTASGLDRGRMD